MEEHRFSNMAKPHLKIQNKKNQGCWVQVPVSKNKTKQNLSHRELSSFQVDEVEFIQPFISPSGGPKCLPIIMIVSVMDI